MNTPLLYAYGLDQQSLRGVVARRFCAFLLDFFFMGLCGFMTFFAITIFGFLTLGLGWAAFHILPWLPFIYYTLLIGGTGATPGQRLSGLSIRQDRDLAPPTFAQACVWSLFFWFSLLLAGLPFLIVFCNQRRRATHDILSGLIFIRSTHVSY